jgi:hypothetical protein
MDDGSSLNLATCTYKPGPGSSRKRIRRTTDEDAGPDQITFTLGTKELCTPITKDVLEQYLLDINRAAWCFIEVGARVVWNQKLEAGRDATTFGIVRKIDKTGGFCIVETVPLIHIMQTKTMRTAIPDFDNKDKRPTYTRKIEPCVLHLWREGECSTTYD